MVPGCRPYQVLAVAVFCGPLVLVQCAERRQFVALVEEGPVRGVVHNSSAGIFDGNFWLWIGLNEALVQKIGVRLSLCRGHRRRLIPRNHNRPKPCQGPLIGHLASVTALELTLQISLLHLLRHGLRAQVKHLVPPIPLRLVLGGQLVHRPLRNRLAQVLLQVVVVEYARKLLVVFRETGRTCPEAKIWIRLDPVWQVALERLEVLRHCRR